MHTYVIKGQNIMSMEYSQNNSWIVKGVMKTRMLVPDIQNSWQQAVKVEKFKMGKMYKALMEENNNVDWSILFVGNIARPRALMSLWMACQRRLATKDRLEKFGFITDSTCCFCRETESIDHLFYNCSLLKNIWADILEWIGIEHTP